MISPTQTFIGSSTHGLPVAEAIQANLKDHTNCRIWTDPGLFLPSHAYLESLERLLTEMDFALLVATPDDVLIKKGVENFSMRDNVLFELGLFMGRIGRKRTYLLRPVNLPAGADLHIPSDLAEVYAVDYELPSGVGDLSQALKDPASVIKAGMEEAQSATSYARKRFLVKRLLALTATLQEYLVTLHTGAVKAVRDEEAFERLRRGLMQNVSNSFDEYESAAVELGVSDAFQALVNAVTDSLGKLPFPHELNVSSSEFTGEFVDAILGGESVEGQVDDRMDSLVARYDDWWSNCHLQLSHSLQALNKALVDAL